VNCHKVHGMQCAVMHCTINSWAHGSASASLSYRLDLNLTTLSHIIRIKDGTTFATDAEATITSLAESVFFENQRSATGAAQTTIQPGILPYEGISWWWYLLAVVCGLLLLTALIYGLYKFGFFRRKEQEEMKALTATVTQAEST